MLVLKNSFWCGTLLMVTVGCAAWNASATFCQIPLSGSAVPLFHQLRAAVALPPPLLLLLPAEVDVDVEPPLLHAAIARVTAAATAAAMRLFSYGSSPERG